MHKIKLTVGIRVRIVSMNGCMAHARENLREGVITEIIKKKVYGDTREGPYAQIQLDNGDFIEKCAEPWFWTIFDRLPEYQE